MAPIAPIPEFTQDRVCLSFVRGFSSVPYLSDEPQPQTEWNARTEALIRLIRNTQSASFQKLMQGYEWAEYDGVYVDGGATDAVDWAAIATATELPIWQGHGGRFAGEVGGFAILAEDGAGAQGMVCDLGQTGLKISWGGRRWTFPRDTSLLPERAGAEPVAVKGQQRRALRKFIGESIRSVTNELQIGLPTTVVCAMPSALDKWGQPLGSSYIGMTNDTQLIPDALEIAGWQEGKIYLINDAELTAISALTDPRVQGCLLVLVVTLGFAIGTASLDLVKQSLLE